MTAGGEQRPDRPDYKVYRSGKGGSGRPATKRERRSSARGDDDQPSYTVYRSRRGPLAKLRGADLGEVRERLRRGRKDKRRREVAKSRQVRKPPWRRVLRYALIGAAAWFLLSVLLFGISAQIQKSKLDSSAADRVGGFPLLVASPQTILVIGTDSRPEATGAIEAETRPRCTNQAATGSAPSSDCPGFRADTLMLVRTGGGAFEKLSIPRDTLANIPGRGPGKINAAYASGGAALQIETVEELLGIDVDHVVLLDFQGFSELIDSIGGVRVTLTERLRSKVDGGSGQGGITLKLDRGTHTLDGARALAFARTRVNLRNPGENDLNRARRQQQVMSGIKGRLTSPWRAPINFIRGPLIAWNAPKAMVSDMGAFTLPQVAIGFAIGGDEGTRILGRRGSTITPAGNISVSAQECRRAVRRFLGEPGPRTPACSPIG